MIEEGEFKTIVNEESRVSSVKSSIVRDMKTGVISRAERGLMIEVGWIDAMKHNKMDSKRPIAHSGNDGEKE